MALPESRLAEVRMLQSSGSASVQCVLLYMGTARHLPAVTPSTSFLQLSSDVIYGACSVLLQADSFTRVVQASTHLTGIPHFYSYYVPPTNTFTHLEIP
jgi:hypothetical protein